METVKDIDEGIETLRGELDRGGRRRRLLMKHHSKYLLLLFILTTFLFLFWTLARPEPTQIMIEQVAPELDAHSPALTKEEYDLRISLLYKNKGMLESSVQRIPGSATLPKILTWAPGSVGRERENGDVYLVVGTYEVPSGWFGAIRLFSDGKEIGVRYVDSRGSPSSVIGDFSLTPAHVEGEHFVRLSFDAVKACRIACDPSDQLCVATNVNYCAPQFDNQVFLTYLPIKIGSRPVIRGR